MTSIGYATLDVIPVARDLAASLEKQTKAGMDKAGRTAGIRFGEGFKSGLVPLAAGAGALGFLNDIKDQASAAEQAVGGLQAVFGQYAEEARRDSETAAQTLGLARTEYQELLTLSGALLKNKGLADFAAQGEKLLSIGADLAAQYGGSTKQAVEALNSALRGESDPIEKYAITLSESAVQAELLARGQDTLTGAALEQAKTMARLRLIVDGSRDAQGAFARESETAAGSAQRATAQWADMRRELGEKVLPAYTEFVSFLNSEGLPALEGVGGVASDVAGAIDDLPGPVKGAAAAFVALRAASALGVTSGLASSAERVASGFTGVRVRAMLAADAYRATATGANAATGANGRLAASFRAVQAGAQVTSSKLGTIAKSAGGLAATAGAFALFEALQPDPDAMGRYVEKIEALAGPKIGDQITALTAELEKQQKLAGKGFSVDFGPVELFSKDSAAAAQDKVDALRESLANLEHQQELGEIAADQAAKAQRDYSGTVRAATDAIRGLIDQENRRRNVNLLNRRDAIALQQAFANAADEAKRGAQTLDINTQAGRDNMSALLDLADQWNSSTTKVRNAKNAYEEMRTKFVELADQMNGPNGTRADAQALLDKLVEIPRNGPYNADVGIPGIKPLLKDLREANNLLALMGRSAQAQGLKNRDELADIRPGARSGPSSATASPASRTTSSQTNINIGTVVTQDSNKFLQDIQQQQRQASLDGIPR